jgi:hypothetical protein
MAFRRRHFTSIHQLRAGADAWLVHDDNRRKNLGNHGNHGDYGDFMRGQTPKHVLDSFNQSNGA